MKKEDFEGLLESVEEAGEILRGARKPAREFFIEVDTSLPKDEGYALCIKSDEPKLLVPFKVYHAKFSSRGRIGIIDEAGEAAVYPPEFFIRIKLPDEVEEVLAEYERAA
ncbi:MAG: hypothetical protein ACR2MG_07510 [Pyrinomonadaceae bacterium]